MEKTLKNLKMNVKNMQAIFKMIFERHFYLIYLYDSILVYLFNINFRIFKRIKIYFLNKNVIIYKLYHYLK